MTRRRLSWTFRMAALKQQTSVTSNQIWGLVTYKSALGAQDPNRLSYLNMSLARTPIQSQTVYLSVTSRNSCHPFSGRSKTTLYSSFLSLYIQPLGFEEEYIESNVLLSCMLPFLSIYPVEPSEIWEIRQNGRLIIYDIQAILVEVSPAALEFLTVEHYSRP